MRCPTCNAELPDGALACTFCNAAFDPAADLGNNLPWEAQQVSDIDIFTSAQGTDRQVAPPAPPLQHERHQAASAHSPAEAGQAAVHTRIVKIDPEQERGTRIVDVSVPQVARRAGRQSPQHPRSEADQSMAGMSQGVEDLFDSMKLGYARMHRVDRMTTWMTLFALVAAFLPWRYELGVGLIAGIQGLGAVAVLAFAVTLACIFARTARRRLTGLLLTIQILAAGGGTSVAFFVFSFQTGTTARFGLYLTALAGIGSIVLTLARLAVRNF